MLVSVIIPAYKKKDKIKNDALNVYNALNQTRWDFEIIIVDDGSNDGTFESAKEIEKANLHAFGYKENRGKGYAVRYGMARAKGDIICFIDAGLEIDPNGISMLLEHMQWYDADVVVGSKRHPASKAKYPFMRKLYSWGYFLGVKFLFGLKITDTQAGIKAYKKEVLEAVLPRLLVKEFAFDIEILAVANYLGFTKIYDAPIQIDLDFTAESKIKSSQPLFLSPFIRGMLIDTIAVFYRMYILKYYDDGNRRKWIYDKNLDLNINTGELSGSKLASAFLKPNENLLLQNVKEDKKFSIIIPVRAINEYLIENFENLQRLNYKNFEVLVMLDVEDKYDFNGDDRFRLITVGNKGPAEKRNIGAKMSTGDILVFLDDDAYPSKNWLGHASLIFNDSKIFALGAPAITPLNASFLERISGNILESKLASYQTVYRHVPQESRKIDDYPTVNLFVRRAEFLEIGGFDENFWPGEDTKLCLDLVEHKDENFLYDPRPVVYHHRRKVFIPHLKQVSRYGRHRGHFAKIFPQNSRVWSYFIPSLFVLGLLFGPVAGYFVPELLLVYAFVVLIYLFLLIFESMRFGLYAYSPITGLFVGFGIFLTHIVYGLNFIVGFLKRPKLELKKFDSVSGNYVEG